MPKLLRKLGFQLLNFFLCVLWYTYNLYLHWSFIFIIYDFFNILHICDILEFIFNCNNLYWIYRSYLFRKKKNNSIIFTAYVLILVIVLLMGDTDWINHRTFAKDSESILRKLEKKVMKSQLLYKHINTDIVLKRLTVMGIEKSHNCKKTWGKKRLIFSFILIILLNV